MTPRLKKTLGIIAKVLVGVVLSWVLIAKLRESTADFNPALIPARIKSHFVLFSLCILLLPLNWMTEALKWKLIVSKTIVPISFHCAFQSVLAGTAFGNLSPGKVTEFAGKIFFIPKGFRVQATYLHFVNGASQLIVTIVMGLIAILIAGLPWQTGSVLTGILWGVIPVLLAFVFTLYFFPGYIFKKLGKLPFIKKFIEGKIEVPKKVLADLLLLSVLRYAIFTAQFVLLAETFFSNAEDMKLMLSGVALYYLFSSCIPMFSVIEPFMRGGIAVLVFGAIEKSTVNIFITSTLIWIVNIVLPSAAGYLFFLFRKTKADT